MENKLSLFNTVMIILLLMMNFGKMNPEQRKEAVKVTIEALDSLNKSFAVVVQKDSLITKDTLVIQADTIKN